MSALLMGRVFYLDLPAQLKFTLLAVADHANDDGESIHVGQERLAAKVGVTSRQVRRNLARLRDLGYLVRTQHGGHDRWTARSFPDSYRLNVDRLPDVPKRVTADTDVRTDIHNTGHPASLSEGNTGHPASVTPDIAMSTKPSERTTREKQPPEGVRAKRGEAEAFVEAYHRLCPSLPRCLGITAKRRQHIAARLRERPLEQWERIFTATNASSFHTGTNDRGWRADLDWLTKNSDNSLKILERESAPLRSVSAGQAALDAKRAASDKWVAEDRARRAENLRLAGLEAVR